MRNEYYGVVEEIDKECKCLSLDELPDIDACKAWLALNKPVTTGTLFFTQYWRDKRGLVFAVCDYDLNGNQEFIY